MLVSSVALVVAKSGSTCSSLLPIAGTMAIITTFITPYAIKFGWKIANTISEFYENRKKFKII